LARRGTLRSDYRSRGCAFRLLASPAVLALVLVTLRTNGEQRSATVIPIARLEQRPRDEWPNVCGGGWFRPGNGRDRGERGDRRCRRRDRCRRGRLLAVEENRNGDDQGYADGQSELGIAWHVQGQQG